MLPAPQTGDAIPVSRSWFVHSSAAWLTVSAPTAVRHDLTEALGAADPGGAADQRENRARTTAQRPAWMTDEVRTALSRSHRPVVALECTIISHGMPFPTQRRDGAGASRRSCATQGAMPATIAVLEGTCHGSGSTRCSSRSSASERRRPPQGHHSRPPLAPRAKRATVPPPSRPRCGSPCWPGSACSSPAGSAACTVAPPPALDVTADLTEMAETACHRHLGRGEVDPRHRPDPGEGRDARRAGPRQRHRRLPVLLLPRQRVPCAAPPRLRRRRSPR